MVAVRGFLGLGDLVREVVGLREGRLVVRLRGVLLLAAGGGNAGATICQRRDEMRLMHAPPF